MKTSVNGLIKIAMHEGIVPAPYLDVVNVWTYGIGHTSMSGEPNPEAMPRGIPADIESEVERAIRLFELRIKSYENGVNRAVTVPLEQHEFDALVGFHFNTGGIGRSSGTPKLNAGDKSGAWRVYKQWNKGTINGRKVVLDALVRRREEERQLFFNGEYNLSPVPVWSVNGSNRPVYRNPLHMVTTSEFRAMLQDDTPDQPKRLNILEIMLNALNRS